MNQPDDAHSVRCPAKVNLALAVGGPRDDGYQTSRPPERGRQPGGPEEPSDAPEERTMDQVNPADGTQTPAGGNREKRLTALEAIRAKCIDCCCGNKAEVRRCTATSCPLHPYRMGKRPKSAGPRTPAQREADRKNGERLAALAAELRDLSPEEAAQLLVMLAQRQHAP